MHVTRTIFAAVTVIALTAAASAKPLTLPAETNLRAAPGTKSEVVTLIPKGSAVEVGECDAGWCKVTFGDKEGFVIGRNVGEAPKTVASPRARTQANAQTSSRVNSPADLQKLRRGYEQQFGGNNRNDVTGSIDDEPEYSQNTQPQYAPPQRQYAQPQQQYVPPRNARPQYNQPQYNDDEDDDDDDVVAYVPPRPPVYYGYGPYPRAYYAPGPYYRRW
jgi:uncharacterized protein YraI